MIELTALNSLCQRALRTEAQKRTGRIRDFDAHSPMFKNRHFNEEKRSRMFADTPFIWGRLPKFLIGWCVCMQFWASYYIYHKHTLNQHLQEQTRKAYRRTVPFVQAMEDVRYCAIQERNYMILRAVCDYTDPALFDLFRNRYNQEDFFISYYKGSSLKNHYDGRYGAGRFWGAIKTLRRPEDEKGLVGLQETSIHG